MFKSSGSARKKSNKIDKQLRKEKKIYVTTYRLLVLGAEGSGKTTIIKQMTILHTNGFSAEERKQKIYDIRKKVRDAILSIAIAMRTVNPPISLADPVTNQIHFDYIINKATEPNFDFPLEFFDHTAELWKDDGIRECYLRSNEYQLTGCAKHFLDRVLDLKNPGYWPSNRDVLECRASTCGIFETRFTVDNINFHMFEVCGQSSQRRKWLQCFNDVSAIIFVTDCSIYNLVLREDNTKNQLRHSLEQFASIWANRWLVNASVILFLNKIDLLEVKLRAGQSPIEDYFPEYATYQAITSEFNRMPGIVHAEFDNLRKISSGRSDSCEFKRALMFFKDKFLEIGQSEVGSRRVYPQFTCAVVPDSMRRLFSDCRDIIQRVHLEQYKLF